MNLKLWLLCCACMIIPNIGMAEKCRHPSPAETTCMFFSPDTTYVGIKVNFKNSNPKQVVYLNGGCSLGIYEFTPKHLNKVDRQVKDKNITLDFTFCINDELINTQSLEVSSDSKILCNVTDKMKCNKIKDESGFFN